MRSIIILVFSIPVCMPGQGQSLAQVMKRHYAEHQQPFWDQLNTISATVLWHGERGDLTAKVLVKKPDKIKIISATHRFIEAFDGEEGWSLANWTDEKVETLGLRRTAMIRHLQTFGSPVEFDDHLVLKGRVEVDHNPCFWLESRTDSTRAEYFIEAKTYLLYKSIVTEERDGETVTLTRTVTDYRSFQGITFPTVVTVKTQGIESEYIFEDIVLGEGIPSSTFARPDDL